MTSIRSENLQTFPVLEQVRQQLQLLPVKRYDANLLLRDATTQETFCDLVDELGFHLVLHQIPDSGITGGNLISVDKYGLAAAIQ